MTIQCGIVEVQFGVAESSDRSDTDNQHIGRSEPEILVVVGDGDPMVEDAASSNAPESQRTRIPPSMVVWTPIGNAWLETLQASAEVEEEKRDSARSRRWPASPTNWLANISG